MRINPVHVFLLSTLSTSCLAEAMPSKEKTLLDKLAAIFERSADTHHTEEHALPKTGSLKIKAHRGSITVRTWKNESVSCDITISGREAERATTSYSIKPLPNELVIESKCSDKHQTPAAIAYVLTVPQGCNLVVQQNEGPISFFDVSGTIMAEAKYGDITIENARSSVTARSPQQSITLTQGKLAPHETIFLQADRDISVTLPKKLSAFLDAQTVDGLISSEVPVTFRQLTTKLDTASWKNIRKRIQATIGLAGSLNDSETTNKEIASITLDTTRGSITIEEWA